MHRSSASKYSDLTDPFTHGVREWVCIRLIDMIKARYSIGMSADDPLLRQLRFSFVLQIIGATLFAIATVIRFVAGGFDLTTIVFLGATILIGVAAFFTRTRIQRLREG